MIYVDGGAKLRSYTPSGATLLDVGCGTGLTMSTYRVGMRSVEFYGVDGYHRPEEVQGFVKFTQQDVDGTRLPYADNFFDVVVLCHILEHVHHPVALVHEVFRILKSGGVVYIETPSTNSLWVPPLRLFNHDYSAANYYDDYTHVGRPQTIHSLFHMLHRNGFDVAEVEYARPKHWILRGLKYMLSGLAHRQRRTLNTGIWYLVGWAVYGVARKNPTKSLPSYV